MQTEENSNITNQNAPTKKPFQMQWKEISVLLGGFVIAQFIVGLVLLISSKFFAIDLQKSNWFIPISYFIIMAIPVFLFHRILLKPKGEKLDFSFQTSSFQTIFLSFGMMLGMMFVSEFLVSLIPISGSIFGPLYESFSKQMESVSTSTLSMVVMTVIFAPILEEFIFRGIILKGMLNQGINARKAIIISALIFGAIHGYPWQLVGAFFLGLILGWVYEKTISLLIPILLHAFNNGIAAYLISNYEVENFANAFHISEIKIFVVGLVILLVCAYFFKKNQFDSPQ